MAFHDTDTDAIQFVASYLAQGLHRDERLVVLATTAHLAVLDRLLRDRGLDLDQARAAGRLVELDAASAVDALLVDGSVDRDRFLALVDRGLDMGAPGPVRIYGEMVAVLWQRGDVAAALELEGRWNELAEKRSFALLCGYLLDTLAGASLAEVGRVCDAHTALVPPRSYATPAAGPGAEQPPGAECAEVFLPVPSAVPAARRFVNLVLDAWGEGDVSWDAAVVTSELATNAVRHGPSPFRASVSRVDGAVRIAVEDVAPGRPDKGAPSPTDVDGRGVAIVEALARRSGWDPRGRGKVAWAELAVRS